MKKQTKLLLKKYYIGIKGWSFPTKREAPTFWEKNDMKKALIRILDNLFRMN